MVNNHYRWDFIGLSTDVKPTFENSEKVVNGSTFYCSDTSKLYVWYKNQWYEKVIEGGGGGATVVQTIGTSTTDVMSQKAVTDELFYGNFKGKVQIGAGADSSSGGNVSSIAIGTGSKATQSSTIAIGTNASSLSGNSISLGCDSSIPVSAANAVAIGRLSSATAMNAVAVGTRATATQQGQFDIGAGDSGWGYNSSNYRLLTGLYDGQSAHDAVTVEQVNATIDAINTALSTSLPHIGA